MKLPLSKQVPWKPDDIEDTKLRRYLKSLVYFIQDMYSALAETTNKTVDEASTYSTHASHHENGGDDEINVNGLNGVLADPQTPISHAATHQSGGADEISVDGLDGVLAQPQTPKTHASSHRSGGSDELEASQLSGALGASGQVLKTDGTSCYWGTVSTLVGQSQLKTSIGSVSTTSTSLTVLVLPGGQYGFYPQLKDSWNASYANAQIGRSSGVGYKTVIGLWTSSSGVRAYAQQRYITASGEVYWIFILRDKKTKQILASYQAPDHPCFGNGGDPDMVPHPFPDFDPGSQEVLVVNPDFTVIEEVYKNTPVSKDVLETLFEMYEIDDQEEPPWPEKEITIDLLGVDFPFNRGKPPKVLRSKINKHPYLRTAGLKRK